MKARFLFLGALGALGLGFSVVASAQLPPLPDPTAPPPPFPGQIANQDAGPNVLLERARRGIVTIERGGRSIAVGTVLPGDGRVLTSLAALGGSDQAEVRYADGTTAHARATNHDQAWDLALLTTQSHWTEGLIPSPADAATARQLAAFVATRSAPAPIAAPFRDRIEARSREGDLLVDAIEFDTRGEPALGTPIVDMTGSVVAVIVRACRDQTDGGVVGAPCAPILVGAPMQAVRHFLFATRNAAPPASTSPPSPPPPPHPAAPWLGMQGEPDSANGVHGVRVVATRPASPAETAGLKARSQDKPGDLIVAVDQQPVDTPDKLQQLIARHAVGDSVKLLVFSADRFREVNVVLGAMQAP